MYAWYTSCKDSFSYSFLSQSAELWVTSLANRKMCIYLAYQIWRFFLLLRHWFCPRPIGSLQYCRYNSLAYQMWTFFLLLCRFPRGKNSGFHPAKWKMYILFSVPDVKNEDSFCSLLLTGNNQLGFSTWPIGRCLCIWYRIWKRFLPIYINIRCCGHVVNNICLSTFLRGPHTWAYIVYPPLPAGDSTLELPCSSLMRYPPSQV